MGFCWAAICLPSLFVLGRFQPNVRADGLSGMALTGMRIYGSLGCVACHTQQIRQLSVTSADVARLWGKRASLVRDTLSHPLYFPGSLRIGPDLSNYALRQQSSEAIHRLLYASQGAGMPSYSFLYEVKAIQGQKSARALVLPARLQPPEGYEILPTYAAECLVAYLLSLRGDSATPIN